VGVAGASILKNNGATFNAVCAYTGVTGATTLNTASKTPDVCTVFDITTTGAATVTVPNPAAGAGSVVYISNMAASSSVITLLGAQLSVGSTATLVYNGTVWTFAGADASGLQTAYNNSAGGTTPEILLDTTRTGLDIQDANATLGASTPLLAVRAAATATTLGTALFSVTNNAGAPLVGVGTNVATRALHVSVNTTSTTSPPLLVEQTNATGDTGIEFKNSSAGTSFFVGQDTSNNSAFGISSANASASSPSTIGFVQSNTNYPSSASAATTITSAFTAANVAGDAIVAIATFDASLTTTATCTDTKLNTYTTVVSKLETVGNDVILVCVAPNILAAGIGANTVTVTYGGGSSVNTRGLVVLEYSNVKLVSPADVTATNQGTTSAAVTDAMTSSTATTSQNRDLLLGVGYDTSATAQTLAAGTSYTVRSNTNNVITEDQSLVTAASAAATFTATTGGHSYGAVMVALKAVTTQGDTFSSSLFTLSQAGAALFKNFANSATGFQIQNATGSTGLLTADTTNNRISLVSAVAEAATYDVSLGGGANRTIGVNAPTSTGAGASLTVVAAAGNAGTGGQLNLNGGAGVGTNQIGGAVAINGGVSTGTAAGGAVTLSGGTAGGSGAGGAVTLQGGAASATAGSTSGAITLKSQNGAAGSGATAGGAAGAVAITGGTGGAGSGTNSAGAAGATVTITAGTGGASTGTANNSNGGSITLQAGSAGTGGSGTAGTAGAVNLQGSSINLGTVGGSLVKNNGASQNVSCTYTGVTGATTLNTAGKTPDLCTSFVITDTAAASITVPNPTAGAGSIVYISNSASSTTSFTLLTANLGVGSTATLVYNGSAWSFAGADTNSLQTVYDNTATSPASIVTSSATKNVLFQAGVSFDNASVFSAVSSSGSSVLTVDTTNSASGGNVAVNGGGETTGTPPTGWVAHNTATITSDVTAGEFASGAAGVKAATGGAALNGVRNNVGTAVAASTNYTVTFSIKVGTALTNANTVVVFSPTGTTSNNSTCSTFTQTTNPAISTTGFIKYTCSLAVGATATTSSAYLAIYQNDSTARNIFIDNLSIIAQNSTGAQNFSDVKVGGATSQGLTLFTFDSYAAAPFTGSGNTNLLGSIYYDTTVGKLQCYEAKGWGSCGNSPNNSAFLIPEYPNAVLGAASGVSAGIGTMTAGVCSGSGRLNVNTSLCSTSTDDYNYYAWTSPQATSQTYSIYVRYQLPATYNGFLSSSTVKLIGRTTSTTDGSVVYALYSATGSTACGTSAALGTTTVTSSNNTWQQVNLAADETSATADCTFAANDIITFRIDMAAKNNATVYASNLTFTTKGL
jgi:hypothetical protein